MDEPGNGRINKNGARYKSSENTQQSITLGDTLTFNPQWSAMLYLSQSWLQTQNFTSTGKQTGENNQNGLSPNAALMYKITPAVMAWISYADSLEQGGTAPTGEGVKNEGQTLDPYRSQQYEIGLKADVSGMNLGAALFRLERPFAYVDANDSVYKEQGNQVNNGLELTASGRVYDGLSIYSGVTFLDPKLKDTVSDSTSDKRVVGVPKVQANMLVEYSLPSMPEWVYSANVHYTGKRAANDTNTAWADSYTTLDLGTRYTTKISTLPTTFRVAVNNVTNEHYWASIFPSGTDGDGGSPSAFLGSGREVRASVTFDF
jgi:iron complex outermembrane receptor protein